MSGYQAARARFGRAISEHRDAQANRTEAQERLDAADAELDAASLVLQRFEIDPEYRLPQHLTGVTA